MKSTWTPLTHEIYRWLATERVGRRTGFSALSGNPVRIGIALSGGADSIALTVVLNDIAGALGLELHLLHVHHGPGRNKKHRDEAETFVKQLAQQLNLPLSMIRSKESLPSEQAMRVFRRRAFLSWVEDLGLDWIATGHHSQDLLETRILRLLRGTGARGFSAISARQSPWLRPFLHISPVILRGELIQREQPWLEDESNRDPRYLRNWVRHTWLPLLEKRSPGAVERWGASLSTLAESLQEPANPAGLWLNENTLSRPVYLQLSPAEQRQALAHLFWRLKNTNYSQSQIEEVRKRLDNPKNEHIFTVSRLLWRVNAEQILARRSDRDRSTEV